ncbi:MAG: sigma-70 family RNA polymerase sigma factor [Chloroflexota bacterium]
MLAEDNAMSEARSSNSDTTRRLPAASEKKHRQLLALVADGDEAAFAEFYRTQSPVVFNYLLRLIHDQNLAEDLLQETFVVVWQGASSFKGRSKVKTWTLSIAHNKAVSWLRRNRPDSIDEATDVVSQDLGPESLAVLNDQNDELLAALDQLSADHRAVVELVFVHELSYKEVGQIVDCPVGTVKSRMSYALKHLQRILYQPLL